MDMAIDLWIFWPVIGILIYTYLGYPLLLTLISRRACRSALTTAYPTVTVVVAAHNEEQCIAQKIRNVLDHDYPAERLDVVVVSDGSTDRTETIVRALEGSRVQLMMQPEQQGKNAALNRGVDVARGDIIVFTDANAMLAAGALHQLVTPFADLRVGLVTGQGVYGELGGGTTRIVSNAYVRYEAFIKRRESALGFIAAADGALYAMRRSLYRRLPTTQVHDLFHPIDVARQGYRSVFVPEAYTVEPPSQDAESEFRRHVRIVSQGFVVFLTQAPSLVVHGYFKAFWMLLSHRFLRWISAPFLLTALMSNLHLASFNSVYMILLGGQVGFYLLAVGGALAERWHLRLRLFAVPYFFCVVSLAGVGGLVNFLGGRRQAIWAPTGGMQ